MADCSLTNMRSMRAALNRSQREMAGLLGVSIRAIQSYEQGWRQPPACVQKLAALLVYLSRTEKMSGRRPCWKVMGCTEEQRAECFAAQSGSGDLCWLITGNVCCGEKLPNWQAKLEKCVACPVVTRWTETAESEH